ncbi:MAG: PIN domain-containing protein [Syntrophales bacterium]|nr:PIN domain-containing protein [Syntrophales bacterium]
MTISDELEQINTIFIDTAPVIYYIEAHPEFGPLVKEVVNSFQSEKLIAFSSVITLTEVLSKPVEAGDEKLAKKFAEFLKHGRNFNLIEISVGIAEKAGRLRGQYPALKTIDSIQLSTAVDVGADVFLTNDKKLKKIKEIKVLLLNDYLSGRPTGV